MPLLFEFAEELLWQFEFVVSETLLCSRLHNAFGRLCCEVKVLCGIVVCDFFIVCKVVVSTFNRVAACSSAS